MTKWVRFISFHQFSELTNDESNESNSTTPSLPLYYQAFIYDTSDKLEGMHNTKVPQIHNENAKLEQKFNKANEDMKQMELKIQHLNQEKDQLEVTITNIKEKFDLEKTDLCKFLYYCTFMIINLPLLAIVTAVKDLKIRNNNLLKTIKLQTKSSNKIDKAREKQNEKWKQLKLEIDKLTNENLELTNMIESLQKQVEELKENEENVT